MTKLVEIVTAEDLRHQRRELLARSGASWADLKRRANEFALNDDERGVYDTVSGIDWMLRHNR